MLMRIRRYFRDARGVAGIIFAMSLPMLIASIGVGVDLAAAYNAKMRLSQALDKATLAAASSKGTDDQLKQIMKNFFYANYPTARYGTPFDVDLEVGENTLSGKASTRVDTYFMRALGKDYIDVSAEAEVVRELAGVEAVLALDMSTSMQGANISALKKASTSFLNTMFAKIADVSFIKIGIVPWSVTVNVGLYGQGKKPDKSYYGTGFVDNPAADDYTATPANIKYGTGTYDWGGCVVEPNKDTLTADSLPPPNWGMYRYPSGSCTGGTCTKYQGSGSNKKCITYNPCTSWQNTPNKYCPPVTLVPLTNDKTKLLNTINSLSPDGYTYSNIGMLWAWRVISPDFPFTEANPYDDPKWAKTVILMTDGDNQLVGNPPHYSGEGKDGAPGVSTTATQQNEKFAAICAAMKLKGIHIYTITFRSDINETTKGYYRTCATSPTMYFDAPSDQSLIDAFTDIANQLSQLHLTK